jgi:rare lipoprotein A (peptidoglycan hydrolase)
MPSFRPIARRRLLLVCALLPPTLWLGCATTGGRRTPHDQFAARDSPFQAAASPFQGIAQPSQTFHQALSADLQIHPPPAAATRAALNAADLKEMIRQLEARQSPLMLEDYLIPASHPWSRRVRMRGIAWPLVLNQGQFRLFNNQTGLASFYHEPQPLASGGRYDPEDMTAAHKTLPFGTIVRCTRLDTGASVAVIVNDRGPYIDGRIIDLSLAAARALDQLTVGVVPCTVEILAYPLIETMGPQGNG